LQTLLALGFMLVCLVNTVALLLVKFLRRGAELGIRRAMGASNMCCARRRVRATPRCTTCPGCSMASTVVASSPNATAMRRR
ncbi:MAG: ABC transporter permease, partial [Rhodanobacter sp.]